MSLDYDYSSIILKPFQKLNRIPALMFILAGLCLLMIVGFSLKVNYFFLRDVWITRLQNVQFAPGGRDVADTVRWAYLIAAILFVPIVLWSIKNGVLIAIKELIYPGLYDLRKPAYFGSIPTNLSSPPESRAGKVYHDIKQRTLSIFRPLDNTGQANRKIGKFLTILLGPKTGMTAPQERTVILNLGGRIGKHLKYFLFVTAILICLVWLQGNLRLNVFQNLFEGRAARALVKLFFGKLSAEWIIIGLASGSVLLLLILLTEITSIYALLPRGNVPTECHEDSIYFEGFGDPYMMLTRLPEWFMPLRLEEKFPNRTYEKDIRFRKDHPVGDTGIFKGSTFIEQQPEYDSSSHRIVALVLLSMGWFLVISGSALLFLPDSYYGMLKKSVQAWEHVLGAPLMVPALGLLISTFMSNGLHFINQAYHLYNTYNYRSIGMLVEIEGYMSRAEIKIGAGGDVSLGEDIRKVCSDFNGNVYAAELLSQSFGIRGERYLTAFRKDDESLEWLRLAKKEISEMHAQGVKAIPLDIGKPVIGIMDTNLTLADLKNRRQLAADEKIVGEKDIKKTEMLPSREKQDD